MQLTAFANEIAEAAGMAGLSRPLSSLERVAQRYRRCLDLTAEDIAELIGELLDEAREFAGAVGTDVTGSSYLGIVAERFSGQVDPGEEPLPAELEGAKTEAAEIDRGTVLIRAVDEIAGVLANEDFELNGILGMNLETLYRGAGRPG